MNIVKRELRANLKSLLVWCGITCLFIVMGFTEFVGYYGNDEMVAIIEAMPSAVLDAFGMKAFNLTTVTGYYGLLTAYIALILSIASILWGSGIVSKEERHKTVEYTLTMPVTRGKVLFSKLVVVIINSAILLGATWLAVFLYSKKFQYEEGFLDFLAITMLGFFIVQMVFLSIGFFLAGALKRPSQSNSMATFIVVGTYFLSLIYAISADLDFLKYFTPFAYFQSGNLLQDLALDTDFVWLSAVIFVVALVSGYLAYNRRDMQI